MDIVRTPLGGAGRRHLGATVRAMEVGQHVIAIALIAIGVVRAIADGTAIPAALTAGIAVLGWHIAGALLPRQANGRLVVWWLVGYAAVWLAAVAVSAEFVWVAFLLWLLAGHLLPGWWALAFSLLVYGGVVVAPVLHHGATSYANVFGPLIGGVFAFGISRGYLQLLRDAAEREELVDSLTAAQRETAQLQDELALAQRHSGALAERTRLARDIHDTVAQTLSSIRLIAHAAPNVRDRTLDHGQEGYQRIADLAGDGLADVRRILAALQPAELDGARDGTGDGAHDGALAAAIERLLDRLSAETEPEPIRTELHADRTIPTLSPAIEVTFLRVAQSALANVRQHAGASRVVVSLIDGGDSVRLDIIDDGVGFKPGAATAHSSFGLGFMRDRLRELGGDLEIESTEGEGTALSAHLPIHHASPVGDEGMQP